MGKKKVTLSVDDKTYSKFQKYCEENAMNFSKKMDLLIREFLKNKKLMAFFFGFFLLAFVFAGNFVDDTQSDFDLGNYSNTTWNGSAIILSGGNLTGVYFSQVFDASRSVDWENVSWDFVFGGVGSQGNILNFNLDDSSGIIVDSSVESNDGIYNGVLYSQIGVENTAIGFDGVDDIINVSNEADFDFGTGDFSIFGWVKRDEDSSPKGFVTKGDPVGSIQTTNGFGFWFASGNVLRFKAQGSSVIDLQTSESVTSSDGWVFIGVVGDRDGNLTIYKNASIIGSKDISSESSLDINSNYNFRVGSVRGSSSTYYFQGDVDGLKVYKRALSYKEVLELFNGTSGLTKLGMRVRSCEDSKCSGDSWIGKYGEDDLVDDSQNEIYSNGVDMGQNMFLFHMDDLSGEIEDTSGNGNNASVFGNIYYGVDCLFDYCLNFSTNSYLQINDSEDFYNPQGFTISGWFKDEGVATGDIVDLISKYANAEEEWYLSADKFNNGLLRFFMYGESGILRRDVTTSDFFDGKWHHLAVSWDGGTTQDSIDIYFDGSEVDDGGAVSGFDVLKDTASDIKIGRNIANNNKDFLGLVDEVSFWNRTLNSTEIYNVYSKSKNYFSVTPFDLEVLDNRYFQYMVNFETENKSYTPAFYSVNVTYNSTIPSSNFVSFVDPTPSEGVTLNQSYAEINSSINVSGLEAVIFDWNGTNYSFYDSSLLFMMNFDNRSLLGENDSFCLDYSGEEFGELLNGAAYSEDSVYGKSVYFDGGDDYINYSNSDYFDIGLSDFSIEFWVKRTGSSTEGILSKGEYGGEGYSLFFTSFDKIRMRAQNDAIDTCSTCGTYSITSADGWTHIVIVGNRSGNYSVYKDSVLVYGEDISGAIGTSINSSYPLRISEISDGGTYYHLSGYLDNLRIYKKVLSSQEINQLYSSSLSKHNDGYWEFFSNQTGLSNETYTAQVFAQNSSSTYSTGLRSFNIGNGTTNESTNETGNITINFPVEFFIVQRNSSNQGVIYVEGIYSGNPNLIEARFDGGIWQTIDSTPSGGSFSGNLIGNVGQGFVEVRFGNVTTVNNSIGNISVGDIYAIAGQSNAEMRGYNSQDYNESLPYLATVYREDDNWRVANDPVDTGTSIGSSWPLLANYLVENQNIPIGFVSAAAGGSAITEWQKGTSLYNNLINQINEATRNTGEIKAILYYQGERDSSSSGTGCQGNYTCYYDNLVQMADDLIADTSAEKVIVGQVNHQPSGTRETNDNIRKAQQDAWNDLNNVSFGPVTYDIGLLPDNLHYKTDAQLLEFARRWYVAIEEHFYSGSNGRGPRIQSAEFDPVSLNLTLVFDKSLNQSSGDKGWRFVDGGTVFDSDYINDTYFDSSSVLILTLNESLESGTKLFLGSGDDGQNVNVPRGADSWQLPTEMIFNQSIYFILENLSYVDPTPANGEIVNTSTVIINSSIQLENVTDVIYMWNGTNFSIFDSSVLLSLGFNNFSSLGDNESYAQDCSNYSLGAYFEQGATYTSGPSLNAIKFDGVDDIARIYDVGDHLDLEYKNFSFSFWIKLFSNGSQTIFTKTDPIGTLDSSAGYVLYLDSDNKLRFKAQSLEISAQSDLQIFPSDGWTHVSVVVERFGNASNPPYVINNVSFYENGVFVGRYSNQGLNTSIGSAYDFRFGDGLSSDEGPVGFFNGSIDDFILYGRALNSDQVEKLFHSAFFCKSPTEFSFSISEEGLLDGSYDHGIYINASSQLFFLERSFRVNLPPDSNPPMGVSSLITQSANMTWIYWSWDNPSDFDFSEAILYLNGTNVANLSGTTYNATNLVSNTTYLLEINTKDLSGNVNTTSVGSIAKTLPDIFSPVIVLTDPTNTEILSSGITSYKVHIYTDENAICRYSSTDTDWDNMVSMPVTGGTQHNLSLSLAPGNDYNYWFLCEDSYGNRMNDSYYLQFSVASILSSSSGSSSGSGGSSSGGSVYVAPVSSPIASLSADEIDDFVVNNLGVKKILAWHVKNNGTSYLNDCFFESVGENADWITHTETNGLASGEEYDFVFDVNIPENISAGSYPLEVFLDCEEINKTEEFLVEIVGTTLNFDLINVERSGDEEVKVDYTLKELSGENQDVKIEFFIFDQDDFKVAELVENKSIGANESQDFETFIDIPSELSGELRFLINVNSETYSGFVQENIVLGAPISGFGIFDRLGDSDNYVSIILIVLFLSFAFFVVRKIKMRKKEIHKKVRKMIYENKIKLEKNRKVVKKKTKKVVRKKNSKVVGKKKISKKVLKDIEKGGKVGVKQAKKEIEIAKKFSGK